MSSMESVVLEPALVITEVFLSIGAALLLPTVAAFASASRSSAARVREELARRDTAAHRWHAWANHTHWDLMLMRACGLDWKPRQWNALPPMIDGRTDALCAMIGNCIYVCGGSRRGWPTNATECLNLDRGVWEALPPVWGRRRVDGDAAMAVLGGKLYVCGGLSFDRSSATGHVDCFDPEQGHWEMLADMPERRFGAAAAVLADRLYICGGRSGDDSSTGVLRFQPDSEAWEVLPPMLGRHYRPVAVVVNGTIYVGQRDCRNVPFPVTDLHAGETASVVAPFSLAQGERYSGETRTWSRCMGAILSSPGASVACVMNSCLYLCESPSDSRPVSERCVRVVGSERFEGSVKKAIGRRALQRNHTT